MKFIKLAILLLFVNQLSHAQVDLYVSNNANISIFVDGTGLADANTNATGSALYVTDGIRLDGTNSRIYLRNGAQLLQGNDGAYNSGIGQLSTYQNGTVSNFNYNYWASPVGNTTANTTDNRGFIPSNNMYDVTNITASNLATYTGGNDGSSSPLVISDRWLYTYNPGAVYADWDYIASTGSAASGYGFTMKGTTGSGNNQLYDFRGKPNTGLINAAVLAPIGGVEQFTLTGNPYPSALDARDFFHLAPLNNAAAIQGSLLFWEQNSASHYLASYVGGYATYVISSAGVITYTPAPWATYDGAGNVTGGVGTSPNNTPGVDAPGRYLPIGQGFMVEGIADTNIEFRNDMRQYWKESSGDSHFFEANQEFGDRSQSNTSNNTATENDDPNTLPEDYMRFRIVVDIEHEGDFFSRELAVNMVDHATEDYDYGMEAKMAEIFPSDAHFNFNVDTPYVILAVPFLEERKIPMTVITAQQQNVNFRAYALQNFPESLQVYVHDIEADLYVNLREQNYTVNLDIGNYTDRFEITFTNQEALDLDDVNIDDFTVFQNNNANQLTILNPNSLDVRNVDLFDINGKSIFKVNLNSIENEYHFPTKNLSDGVYITTITLSDNTQVKKKVIIKNN